MNSTDLLKECFSVERWTEAIDKAVQKGMNRIILSNCCSPSYRKRLYIRLLNDEYTPLPPHEAKIPKENSKEFRTVYINEDEDRVFLSIVNSVLNDVFKDMVHSSCRSYQKKKSFGETAVELSRKLKNYSGVKTDFHKYFDTVEINKIMEVFDLLEDKLRIERNTDPIVNMLRRIWKDNRYISIDGKIKEQYMGIRQGNAVGSFFANVLMYELDEFMSSNYPYYVRYSDDAVTLTERKGDYKKVINDINRIINKYGIKLNNSKTVAINNNSWFSFLGFFIKPNKVTLNGKWTKHFKNEIQKCTVKNKNISYKQALNNVYRFLYGNNKKNKYSWATSIFPYINVREDILILDKFVMDNLRAVKSVKKIVGGIGVNMYMKDNALYNSYGKHAARNRGTDIEDYTTISCMYNAYHTDMAAFNSLCYNL